MTGGAAGGAAGRAAARTSCGVLVTDGAHLLLGHATGSPRWDIPKGLAEMEEPFAQAALRELREETGLCAPPGALEALGVHDYLPGKRLALFRWRVDAMPPPGELRCASVFRTRDGREVPEFDRFAAPPWAEALTRLGRNMARVLTPLAPIPGPPASPDPRSSPA